MCFKIETKDENKPPKVLKKDMVAYKLVAIVEGTNYFRPAYVTCVNKQGKIVNDIAIVNKSSRCIKKYIMNKLYTDGKIDLSVIRDKNNGGYITKAFHLSTTRAKATHWSIGVHDSFAIVKCIIPAGSIVRINKKLSNIVTNSFKIVKVVKIIINRKTI